MFHSYVNDCKRLPEGTSELQWLPFLAATRIFSHGKLEHPNSSWESMGVSIVMGVPPVIHLQMGFSLVKTRQPFWGTPMAMETPWFMKP